MKLKCSRCKVLFHAIGDERTVECPSCGARNVPRDSETAQLSVLDSRRVRPVANQQVSPE